MSVCARSWNFCVQVRGIFVFGCRLCLCVQVRGIFYHVCVEGDVECVCVGGDVECVCV